jgi:hypothetical protein
MEGLCANGNEYFESITDEEFVYQQSDSASGVTASIIERDTF